MEINHLWRLFCLWFFWSMVQFITQTTITVPRWKLWKYEKYETPFSWQTYKLKEHCKAQVKGTMIVNIHLLLNEFWVWLSKQSDSSSLLTFFVILIWCRFFVPHKSQYICSLSVHRSPPQSMSMTSGIQSWHIRAVYGLCVSKLYTAPLWSSWPLS